MDSSAPKPDDSPKVMSPTSRRQDVGLVLDFALLIDELTIAIEKNEASAKHLSFVRERILQILEMHEVEIIRDANWNPVRQRAVRVSPAKLDLHSAVLDETISYGVALSGQVVKKQDVTLKEQPAS